MQKGSREASNVAMWQCGNVEKGKTCKFTYIRTPVGFPIDGVYCREHEHKTEEECEEEKGIEKHPIRHPPGGDLYFDELPHPLRRKNCDVPQAGRDV